jgi:hypothetical protein
MIVAFRQARRAAFAAECERWKAQWRDSFETQG